MSLNHHQQSEIAALLGQFSAGTVDAVLNQFDMETRQLIRQSLAAPPAGRSPGHVLNEFADFLFFGRDEAVTSSRNPSATTAGRDASEPADFRRLFDMDDTAIDSLLAYAPPELTIQVLCCSPTRFIERVLSRLSDEEADTVTRRINESPPMEYDHVQQLQTRYYQLALELTQQGLIQMDW